MSSRRARAAGLALAAGALAACGDDAPAGGDGDPRCTVPGGGPGVDPSGALCERLSSYGLFTDVAAQVPAEGVVPYTINTPLFSDYTLKDRFVWLPEGTAMTWHDREAFELPVGAVLIKTFSYPLDQRDPAAGRRVLETRLLVREDGGWNGASYVHDGDDAILKVAGAAIDAAWTHHDGAARTNRYAVPNKNQCKNCHAETGDFISPLGPKARHLNGAGGHDQLQALIDRGALAGAPAPDAWPRAPVADDPASGTLDERARAWLEINCASCHNPRGPARTSGLFLEYDQLEPTALGVCKPPVAAGRGSGGRAYGIVPGDPDASILTFRIESTELDIKMPELGRNLVDAEGVALIRAWIAAMPGACN